MPIAQRLRGPQVEQALTALAKRSQQDEAEAAALGIIRDTAQHLRTAGQALQQAAHELKSAGRGVQANRAFVAGQAALEAADGLVST